jgi:hypothetical protein
MARSVIVAMLALILAEPALAVPVESCCACVQSASGQTAQAPPPVVEQAYFCSLVTGMADQVAFDNRCYALNGAAACLAKAATTSTAQDNIDCPALLAEDGIACPATKPVPAAGLPLLAVLAAALVGLGAWAARRRSRATH